MYSLSFIEANKLYSISSLNWVNNLKIMKNSEKRIIILSWRQSVTARARLVMTGARLNGIMARACGGTLATKWLPPLTLED